MEVFHLRRGGVDCQVIIIRLKPGPDFKYPRKGHMTPKGRKKQEVSAKYLERDQISSKGEQ